MSHLNNFVFNEENITKISKDQFGHYLAGLIEGDGTIIVPKTKRNDKGKLQFPLIKICFPIKDLPLAIKIKENLGGTIIKSKGNYID